MNQWAASEEKQDEKTTTNNYVGERGREFGKQVGSRNEESQLKSEVAIT